MGKIISSYTSKACIKQLAGASPAVDAIGSIMSLDNLS